MTKGINKSIITTKNKLFYKCYKQNNPQLAGFYKRYQNILTSVKRLAKQLYYTQQLKEHKHNMFKQLSVIHELLGKNFKKNNTIKKLVESDKIITSNVQTSNTLNDYFVNIGPTLSAKINDKKLDLSNL